MFAFLGLGRSGPAAAARGAPSSQPPIEALPSPHRPALSRVASPAASPHRSSLARPLLNFPVASPLRSTLAPSPHSSPRHGTLRPWTAARLRSLDLVERGERRLLADTLERLMRCNIRSSKKIFFCKYDIDYYYNSSKKTLTNNSHLHENAAVRRNILAHDAVRLELREFLEELG
ncbi:hypothetical protein T492DRAFT_931847 [Pavlovales sp. CCMP2436]|nr:hypothetical protein T492DRAFT_931847 [Pavlovales sp. CCMP2436]